MKRSLFIVLTVETPRSTMNEFPSFFVVVRLLVLLTSATVIVSLDQSEFSETLRMVVDNILGAQQFEVNIVPLCIA